MFELVEVSFLEKSVNSIPLIGIILLVRRYFNIKSIKYANKILWTILFAYLLIPYSILIDVQGLKGNVIFDVMLKPVILMNRYSKLITIEFGEILSIVNRITISALILIYIIYQVFKMNKELIGSTPLGEDNRIKGYIKIFNFKRKIQVLVNDDIRVPLTYIKI